MTEFLTTAQAENDLMEFLKGIPSWPPADEIQPTHYSEHDGSIALVNCESDYQLGWDWQMLCWMKWPTKIIFESVQPLHATRQQWEAAHAVG